ncbi:MAG: hypothetical protein JO337_03680 [Acidimicrobiales bacterium]|nr:hypothetical protein [Acidimicrobiales bacterium]
MVAERYTTLRLGKLVPIPQFDERGCLPPGDHLASWQEIEDRYGNSIKRQRLLNGLSIVVQALRKQGVHTIWIDGSFVTDKPRPSDVDVVYRPPTPDTSASWGLFSPGKRSELKRIHAVDLWPYPSFQMPPGAPRTETIKSFFSHDLNDVPKGLIELEEPEDDQE